MTEPPRNRQEFDRVMREIEDALREKGVAVHARGIHTGLEYARRFGLEHPMATSDMVGTPGNYADNNVDAHIRDWHIERYGEKLKVRRGPGTIAVLVGGDPWKVPLPRVFGEVAFEVHRDLGRNAGDQISKQEERPHVVLNVLALIEDLPQGLASRLDDSELRRILSEVVEMQEAMQELELIHDRPYIFEALADVEAAVTHLMARSPHYGQSKWASSQVAEKSIKCVLRLRGAPFRFTHNLSELSQIANEFGVSIGSTLLAQAAASSSMRYGETPVSLLAAARGHLASLRIAKTAARALR